MPEHISPDDTNPEEINDERRRFLGTAAMTIAAAEFGALGSLLSNSRTDLLRKTQLMALGRATEWINSAPLTEAGVRDKPVLINFCTYTCINWLRTVPYVRAWADQYQPHGLVMIGVHTPEFTFEKNLDNVRRELKATDIRYPVAVDSDYAIWTAFDNHYWPALYLLDGKGRVRYRHFGEGQYAESDKMIRGLLPDTGAGAITSALGAAAPQAIEVAADWNNLKTGETYVGYARMENFASPEGRVLAKDRLYTLPRQLRVNDWALAGHWTFQREALALGDAGGRIAMRFHARDLHLVMGPAAGTSSARFRVLVDGRPPGGAHGADVDAEGNGVVAEQRLYQLIRQSGPIADRQFEIEYLDPGVEAFVFTFG
jgi:hypothetical protein